MGRAFEFRKARKMKRWSAMSKAFTRIGKDIVMAVKDGGPDPDSNSKLRAVIQNAKSVNMPKDNVERAIKRASDKSLGEYKEVLFEGYVENPDDNSISSVKNTSEENQIKEGLFNNSIIPIGTLLSTRYFISVSYTHLTLPTIYSV